MIDFNKHVTQLLPPPPPRTIREGLEAMALAMEAAKHSLLVECDDGQTRCRIGSNDDVLRLYACQSRIERMLDDDQAEAEAQYRALNREYYGDDAP